MEAKEYPLYKGLQKPLTFKGFKGRYIFWGIGVIISSLLLGCILCIAISTLIGMGVMACYLGLGLFIIHRKQKNGLYSKKRDKNTLFLMPNKIKLTVRRK